MVSAVMSDKRIIASIVRSILLTVALTSVAADAFAAGSISGRVTSSTTGNGLGGTVIQVFDINADRFAFTATADGMGFYTVDLPPGSYALLTQNTQGYINEIWDNIQCSAVCDVNSITPIAIGTDPVTNINFVLDPGARVT